MPLVEPSSYCPPWYLGNGHVQTIWPVLYRPRPEVKYQRERIETPDGDFLDLDWARVGGERVVVICHGLEGSSAGIHELGMVSAINAAGRDALVMNFRGCSGEMNRTLRFYHSGETEDLRLVVAHAARSYSDVALSGFSLGGNVVLMYLGKSPELVHPAVSGAAVFSVPCDLGASAKCLEHPANVIYLRRFIRHLSAKVRSKAKLMPGVLDVNGIERLRNFREFDGRYTAPIHGFADAETYWRECSSANYVGQIRVPTLLVNALDDPFLPPACYPVEQARQSQSFYFECPKFGGHNGFMVRGSHNRTWAEARAVEFLEGAPAMWAAGARPSVLPQSGTFHHTSPLTGVTP